MFLGLNTCSVILIYIYQVYVCKDRYICNILHIFFSKSDWTFLFWKWIHSSISKWCFIRLATIAGCVGRTATVISSGSSISPPRSTKNECSTLRTIRTAGSIASPQEPSKFANGQSNTTHITLTVNSRRWQVCTRSRFLMGTCTEEELCKLAHGDEELKEWKDRREFLLMKLAKATKDHLIAPNDNDFGKYSFLLKDIK